MLKYFLQIILLLGFIKIANAQQTAYNGTYNNTNAVKYKCSLTGINKDYTFKNRVDGVYNIDYIVDCNIVVSGTATLTIEPGVAIEFRGAGNGIVLQDNATLIANGNENNGIILTSKEQQKGDWRGIVFNTKSNGNQINHAIIESAGGTANWFNGEKAGITLLSKNYSCGVNISNCRITNSGGYGVWIGKKQNLTGFVGNSITYNQKAGVAMYGNNLSFIEPTSDYTTGNGFYFFEIMGVDKGSGQASIETDVVWPPLQQGYMRYRVTKGDFVVKGCKLTILPNVAIEFEGGTGLCTFESNISNPKDGAIVAIATDEQPIIFTGIGTQAPWKGIAIMSASPETRFEYCHLMGGGTGTWLPIGGVVYGSITLYSRFRKPMAIIQKCTITNSHGYGIAAKGSANYPAITNATIATSNYLGNNSLGDIYK